jgi:ribosome-binding protein aMBF1 (putative translation factor)
MTRTVSRLEMERRQRGWTQRDLADRLKTWPQVVSAIERGRLQPSDAIRKRLSELFEEQVETLLQPVV